MPVHSFEQRDVTTVRPTKIFIQDNKRWKIKRQKKKKERTGKTSLPDLRTYRLRNCQKQLNGC